MTERSPIFPKNIGYYEINVANQTIIGIQSSVESVFLGCMKHQYLKLAYRLNKK